MPDTFMDLPLHVLVLHFAVVLIPLSAGLTAAVALKPALRARPVTVPMIGKPPVQLPALGLVAALNVGLLVLTFVTVRAGYALQSKMDPTKQNIPNNDHRQYGEVLLWIVLALAVVSVITFLASRMASFAPAALTGLAAVVAVLAIASAGMTVVTGHTGSQSHWGYLYKTR